MEDDLRRMAGFFDDVFDFLGRSRLFVALLVLLYLFISMPFMILLTFIPLIYYSTLVEGSQKIVLYAMILVWGVIFFDVAHDFYYSRHPFEYERMRKRKEKEDAEKMEKLSTEYGKVIERRRSGEPFLGLSAFLSRMPLKNRAHASVVSGFLFFTLLGTFLTIIGFSIIPPWATRMGEFFRMLYTGLTLLGYSLCGTWGAYEGYKEREASRLIIFGKSLYASLPVGIGLALLSSLSLYGSHSGMQIFVNIFISATLFVCVGWFFYFVGGLLGKDMK